MEAGDWDEDEDHFPREQPGPTMDKGVKYTMWIKLSPRLCAEVHEMMKGQDLRECHRMY